MKHIYPSAAFLFFLSVQLSASLLISCQAEARITEQILVSLPSWPPEGSLEYPELITWKIQIDSPFVSSEFCTTENSFIYETEKNIPFSVIATPITKTKNPESESYYQSSFFYPAGAIYPYYTQKTFSNIFSGFSKETLQLDWESGFTAAIFQKICKSRLETGITKEHIQDFLVSFNWEKFKNEIYSKTKQSAANFENIKQESSLYIKFYNPWQINTENLLTNLCYANFSISNLEPKNTINLQLNTISNLSEPVLSPYIPENYIIQNHNQITVLKNQPQIFMYGNIYALQITPASSKKVSVDVFYLPILYSDI